jgi:hypothetical protein
LNLKVYWWVMENLFLKMEKKPLKFSLKVKLFAYRYLGFWFMKSEYTAHPLL